MEHRNSASSKDNGGLFTALLQMYGCGSQTGSDDSIPGITSTNCQPESQASCLKTESRSSYMSDLSTYMESFPSDMETSNFAFSVETSSRMGCPPEVSPRMPSETLLEAISVAQRRLQHLEVIVRMMIQWRGQPHMAQQYHSLWMEYTSIMSQLSAATKFVSFSPPFQTSPSLAPLAIDTFDFELDGFNDGDLYKTLGEDGGLPRPPTSGMDVMLSGVCQGIGLSLPPWTMDVSATPLEPMASSDEVANILARAHTHGIRDENTKEKGTLANSPKIGKAHYALEIHDQMPIPTDEIREDDDDGDCESLPPGSYELIELAATEILAEHTHFCEICGKGFKRDANLRMHMRGHGDEYKTAAALARPDKLHRDSPAMKLRRYSCLYAGCKRNKKHQKFQPLKTMLCVKNHYRRSHCPKVLVCSRCTSKKFSVVADLKTHEKHCGQDKWQCSCGTTFSRKDKLHGHIGLFAGHAPATPAHEAERVENFRGCTEVLTSSYTNALGIPANVTENDNKTSHDGNEGLDVYKMPAMVTRTHESDKGSYMEDSLNESGNGCSFMS